MPVSNTIDCFREFIGLKVIGLLYDTFPESDGKLAAGSKTLVFEDGRGLTISSNGSFWIESESNIRRAIEVMRVRLLNLQEDTKALIKLAGTMPS